MLIKLEDVKKHIKNENYIQEGLTTTCFLDTTFDMRVVGVVHCQDKSIFDCATGLSAAYDKAIAELFPLVIAYSRGKAAIEEK